MTRRSVVPAVPVGQQGPPARAAASAVGALRSARGSHLRPIFDNGYDNMVAMAKKPTSLPAHASKPRRGYPPDYGDGLQRA